jgi:hypothetical protein
MGKKIFTEIQVKDILDKYVKDLMSTKEISKVYSCDSGTIARVLKENNIHLAKGSAFSVTYWKERGLNDEQAKYKVKTLKPSIKEYWISRGLNEDEAILKTELHLMNTERTYIIKYGEKEGRLKYREKKEKDGKFNSNRSKEYWISRGLNEDEATEKIRKRQKTFSLDICIEKYGITEGTKIFNERQKKWVETLKQKKDYDIIQTKKVSKSPDSIFEKYPETFVDTYFKFNIKNEKIYFLKEPVKNKNYEEFLELTKKNIEYDSKLLRSIANISLFKKIFNKTYEELYLDLKKSYGVRPGSKQAYGTIFLIDGIVFKSLGEKLIYEKLKNLNINFIYDKFYPNQKKFKYDFYLPDYNTYIEYYGMLNVKVTEKSKKIIRNYKIKCKEKMDLCVTNNYRFIFSNEIDKILVQIDKLKNDE